jgi:release factor glutamine methyltransferase
MGSSLRTRRRDWRQSGGSIGVTATLGWLLVEASTALSAAGFGDPRRHARRLLASALGIPYAHLVGNPDRELDDRQIGRIRGMLGRMLDHEPLSRILGVREFWGLSFALSADTLDPRPETETVIEAVLRRKSDRHAPLHVLDLGTGTGCLLLALLHEFPSATGVGIDIAEGAVTTASRNAASLGLAARAVFSVDNWGAAVSGKFGVIVANPPYVARGDLALLQREVACYDPRRALDGGEDGLDAYRAIATDLPRLLATDGIFVTEIGVGQGEAAAAILKASGLAIEGIEEDIAGIPRCLIARRRGRHAADTRLPRAKNDWNTPRSRLG